MLYISDIFNVDTKEHYDRIKSFTQAQMMYCVELRDFTTGEQRAMCMPKVVVAEEIILFGVVAGGYLCVLDKMFVKLLDNIDTEIISTLPEDTQAFDCIKFYSSDEYGLFFKRPIDTRVDNIYNLAELLIEVQNLYPSVSMFVEGTRYFRLGRDYVRVTFDKDMTSQITKYKIRRNR